MTWQIKIEDKDDLDLMKSLFEGSVRKIKGGTTLFDDESAARILRIYESLTNASEIPTESTPEVRQDDTGKGKKNKGSGRGQSKTTNNFVPNLCSDHPSYGAIRPPRTDCKGCWAAYKRMNPTKYSLAKRDFDRRERLKAEENGA